jgi:hypothetical protein
MRLFKLAFACYIYRYKADDKSYVSFLDSTNGEPDLNQQSHRSMLIEWLRDWGCRQFAKKDHALASEEIKHWHKKFKNHLPKVSKNILDLTENEIKNACAAYEDLKERIASKRKTTGHLSTVRIGATGAGKTLFILRPNSLILWDEPIRKKLGLDGSGESYKNHMLRTISDLEELEKDCRKAGLKLIDLPKELGRPKSTLVKMVDEYYWITETNQFEPPTDRDFTKWSKWRNL